MYGQATRLSLLSSVLLSLSLSGCASTSWEYRDTDHSSYSSAPVGNVDTNHKELNASDIKLTQDAMHGTFSIAVTADTEEFETVINNHERRLVKPPAMIRDDAWIFLLVIPVLNCVPPSSMNCFTYEYGDWQVEKQNNKTVKATGKRELKELPLQHSYDGTLTVTGYDDANKNIGTAILKHTFKDNNAVSFEPTAAHFSERPQTMSISGQFATPKGTEQIAISIPREQAAQIKYGLYAWATPEQKRAIAIDMRTRYYSNPDPSTAKMYTESLQKIGADDEIASVRKFQTTIMAEIVKWEKIYAPTANSGQRDQAGYYARRAKFYKNSLDAVERLGLKGYDDYLIGQIRESRSRAESLNAAVNAPPAAVAPPEPSADEKAMSGFQEGLDMMIKVKQLQNYR
jgi:hypothetical protein